MVTGRVRDRRRRQAGGRVEKDVVEHRKHGVLIDLPEAGRDRFLAGASIVCRQQKVYGWGSIPFTYKTARIVVLVAFFLTVDQPCNVSVAGDRKSTRLNSSH